MSEAIKNQIQSVKDDDDDDAGLTDVRGRADIIEADNNNKLYASQREIKYKRKNR